MDAEITKKLRTPIPAQLVKQLNGKDYISGQTAIDRLIQATDNDWSFHITNVIHTDQRVAMQGELTIAGTTRTAWGESKSTGNAQEELYKNAETDTLKRCARLFGVALELYGDLIDEETGEVTHRGAQRTTARPLPPQGREMAPPTPQRTQAQPAATDADAPTPTQLGKMRHTARDMGWQPDEVKDVIAREFGKGSSTELTKREVSRLIEILEAGVGAPA